MDFVPRRFPGLALGAGITLGMLALSFLFVRHLLQTPISIISLGLGAVSVLTAVAAALFGYWTFGCLRLKYALNEGNLIIRWGPTRHVVPVSLIERAFAGDEAEARFKVRGLNWTGYHVGWSRLSSIDKVIFYSTHRSPRELVYIVTPGLSYGISPPNPRAFMSELREMKQRLSGPQPKPKIERWFVLRLPVWKDRYAHFVMLAGFAVNVALFAYVTYYFPSLPELLPMHFTVLGEVDLIGVRMEVLKLPAMAFFVFASNLAAFLVLHARERVAAYLCLVAGVFVQVVFWVATVRIVY